MVKVLFVSAEMTERGSKSDLATKINAAVENLAKEEKAEVEGVSIEASLRESGAGCALVAVTYSKSAPKK